MVATAGVVGVAGALGCAEVVSGSGVVAVTGSGPVSMGEALEDEALEKGAAVGGVAIDSTELGAVAVCERTGFPGIGTARGAPGTNCGR